jgi:DNA-binding NtrC family response regulator
MKLADLQLFDLLDLRPNEGTILLKNQRMIVQSADAMGLLRKELLTTFGIETARRLLLRFGYAHGYEDSLNLREGFNVKTVNDSVVLACQTHSVLGIVRVEPLEITPLPNGGLKTRMIWRKSFEAEQHMKHFGLSETPVCWSLVGYASGSRSAAHGRDYYYREVKCVAKGDPYCEVEGRDAASWGADLPSFEADFSGSDLVSSSASDLRAELNRLREVTRFQNQQLLRYEQKLSGRDADGDDLRARIANAEGAGRFIVRSSAMSEAIEQATRIAPIQTPVLVQGESGTGKEFVVNLIHQQSGRSAEPFVSVNCAALTETLLESELFGHVRGAFTGAVRDKIGLFELANRGTLFLDEIGEMDLVMQAKLLRVLENGEIRRVGGERCIRVHPRIVAATNRDLRAHIEAGKFRGDLYFRLGAFIIKLPPLRDRIEEIPPMVHEFMRAAAGNLDKKVNSVCPEAMRLLTHYSWPGNVRELKHAIERAVIVAKNSVIQVNDLPQEITAQEAREATDPLDLKGNELHLLVEALRKHHGNRAAAARALHISPVTLWRKIRRHGIQVPVEAK